MEDERDGPPLSRAAFEVDEAPSLSFGEIKELALAAYVAAWDEEDDLEAEMADEDATPRAPRRSAQDRIDEITRSRREAERERDCWRL